MNDEKCVVPVPTMSARIAPLTATGGEGTTDYNKLKNKPSINDIPLQGNKTLDDLGIQPAGDYALKTDVPDTSDFIKKDADDLDNYYNKTTTDDLLDQKQPIGNYASFDDIPTDISELNNDVGYITGYTETDPTVPDYVKNITEDDIARWNAGGGGGEGTSDYNALNNKPKINGKVLLNDVSLEEIGAQPEGDYVESQKFTQQVGELNIKLDGKQDAGDYALKSDIPDLTDYPKKDYVDGKIDEVKKEIPDVSSFITKTVDNLENYYKKAETYTQEEINGLISKIPKMHFEKVEQLPDVGDEDTIYLVESDNPDEKNVYEEYIYINGEYEIIGTTKVDLSGIQHDIENLTELYKELADEPEQIYVGYISSITPGRDAIEVILEDAIKSGASTLILRPTVDLPQDFTAISSGPNLQKYKNGGSGTIKFTDVNEHTTINAMPSVISYVTTVSFAVTADDEIDVTITDVQTKFISGINSTSQQAYVLHTKNEEEYTPTKPYHPSTKKYVDDADIKNFTITPAFSDGLMTLNATKGNDTNVEIMGIYNGLDGKYPNASLSATAGKTLNDKVNNYTSKYFTTTLLSSEWVQNSSTNYYEYTVNRSDITANTFVDISMDLDNLVKINGGAVESFAGKFVISTYEQPTEDIEISVRYSLTTGV